MGLDSVYNNEQYSNKGVLVGVIDCVWDKPDSYDSTRLVLLKPEWTRLKATTNVAITNFFQPGLG